MLRFAGYRITQTQQVSGGEYLHFVSSVPLRDEYLLAVMTNKTSRAPVSLALSEDLSPCTDVDSEVCSVGRRKERRHIDLSQRSVMSCISLGVDHLVRLLTLE